MIDVELVAALRTNGSVRAFREQPVADDVVYRVLDTARFAPNGGNRQPWGVLVIKDPTIRIRMRELSQLAFREYAAHERVGVAAYSAGADGRWPGPTIDIDAARAHPASFGFVDHLEQVPVWLLLTADLTKLAIMDNPLDRQSIVGGASIYPFGQNVLLAARAEGLGGVLTTFVVREEVAVRELLGFPTHIALAALVVLGYPEHQTTKLRRNAVEDFTRVDRWDGLPFHA